MATLKRQAKQEFRAVRRPKPLSRFIPPPKLRPALPRHKKPAKPKPL